MAALTKVTFVVRAEVAPGETVVVSGDAVSMGGFAPSGAISLRTTPERYPLWTTQHPITVPRHFPLKYRWCGGGHPVQVAVASVVLRVAWRGAERPPARARAPCHAASAPAPHVSTL